MNDEIVELTTKVEELLAMLKPLEEQGDRKATLFAEGVRDRLSELRKATASGDSIHLSNTLLDIVPTPKDLDAIDFRLNLHPDIRELSSKIRVRAAEIA